MSSSSDKPLHIVLLGPPASGKGTQGRRLAASLGLAYLSTGAVLREQVESSTALGKLADPILAHGEYLPDDLMFPIIVEWLTCQTGGWVLDGFPRSLPQAVFLDQWLAARHLTLDLAVSLEAPYQRLRARIRDRVECPDCRWSGHKNPAGGAPNCPLCGKPTEPRADDSEENFNSRYSEFQHITQPVIDHYRFLELFAACDATDPPDDLAASILRLFARQPAVHSL